MAEERWQDNPVVKVSLWGLAVIIVLLGVVYLLEPESLPEGVSPTDYRTGDWVSTVPRSLAGTWSVEGQCENEDALMLIFSNGGYRWRKSRADWGFARGHYRYTHPDAYSVEFRLQRLAEQRDQADSVLTVSGPVMRKFNPLGGTMERFEKCPG